MSNRLPRSDERRSDLIRALQAKPGTEFTAAELEALTEPAVPRTFTRRLLTGTDQVTGIAGVTVRKTNDELFRFPWTGAPPAEL